MFRLDSIIHLKDEENVQAVVRRHVATLVPPLFLAMIFIVLPFFLLFPLFSIGAIGVIIFAVLVLIGIVIAARTLMLWDADVLVITNERVVDVDQKGLLARKVTEASLSVIQDVSWKREGIAQTVFRMGTLQIQTAGGGAAIQVGDISYPQVVHELINELRHQAPKLQAQASDSPVQKDRRSRIRHIAELLEHADDQLVMQTELALERNVKDKSVSAVFGANSDKV